MKPKQKGCKESNEQLLYGRMCRNPLHIIQTKFLHDEEKMLKRVDKPNFRSQLDIRIIPNFDIQKIRILFTILCSSK